MITPLINGVFLLSQLVYFEIVLIIRNDIYVMPELFSTTNATMLHVCRIFLTCYSMKSFNTRVNVLIQPRVRKLVRSLLKFVLICTDMYML